MTKADVDELAPEFSQKVRRFVLFWVVTIGGTILVLPIAPVACAWKCNLLGALDRTSEELKQPLAVNNYPLQVG